MTVRFKVRREFTSGGTVYLRDQSYNAGEHLAEQLREWHRVGLVSVPDADDMPEQMATLSIVVTPQQGAKIDHPNRPMVAAPTIRADFDREGLADTNSLKLVLIPGLWSADEIRLAIEHAIVAAETRR